ncbi:MAG: GerMN domain-containing protein, partial [Methanomassiliicoccales archaeon]
MKRLGWFLLISLLLLTIGGCSQEKLKSTVLTPWDKWVKTPVSQSGDEVGAPKDIGGDQVTQEGAGETIPVAVYYLKDGTLSRQMKPVAKVEGIARRTLQEQFKAPVPIGFKSAFPAGIRLNDINLKPDGTCIIDVSSELLKIKGDVAKKTAIAALTR